MAFLSREARIEVCVDDLECRCWPYHPSAERKHVHVVMLNRLVSGVVIVNDGAACASDLVCGDRCPCSGSAHDNPSVGLSGHHRSRNRCREVRVVDGVGRVRANVSYRSTPRFEVFDKFLLQGKSSVIGSDHHTHVGPLGGNADRTVGRRQMAPR